MIVINFSHPFPPKQVAKIEHLANEKVEQVFNIAVQFDCEQPFAMQIVSLVDQVPLSAEDWQTSSILINPPSLNFIAILLLAELHGRTGYFPAHIRVQPMKGALPQRYEVAEILDLQGVRNRARQWRVGLDDKEQAGRNAY